VRFLADRPFLAGLVTTLALLAVRMALPADALTSAQSRGVGLMVFGGMFAVLSRFGLDRDDAFWVFLGGVCGLLAAIPFVL
jgi:hypothetical protein